MLFITIEICLFFGIIVNFDFLNILFSIISLLCHTHRKILFFVYCVLL